MTAPDTVVVGGGVIGASIAWRAAQRGLAVAMVDPHPGRGASWAAAGMLAPVTEVHYGEEELLALNLTSSASYRQFVAELSEASGRDPGYAECGTLTVARDADDNAALESLFEFQRGLGLDVQRLRGRECRRLEPALAPSTRGGILVSGDHQVDNRALVDALLIAAERSGVHVVRRRAESVELAHERVAGVRLADGERIGCSSVVLAAGATTAPVEGLPPGVAPPVRPVKGQLLHLRGPAETRLAMRNVRGLDAYIVTRSDGRVVIGATVEERGFDERVTAGGVHDLLRAGFELLPGVTELELVETSVGLRPGTPDNAPILGKSEVEGLVIATGHYRNGVLLTPITSEAISELLVTGDPPKLIEAFSPRRFSKERVA
ncbi:MAG: glycine oxidase ThiO [Actinomycetota bacterium]|nr:glycine oxidase ThiO [Actinomycetota bacterium]